jgi:putative oxidoreductase
MTRTSAAALSALRIVSALLFMEHGLMKLFGWPIAQPGVSDPLPTLLVAAAALELVGGGLLTIGLFTPAVAFVCSGEMAAAYFIGHASKGFWPGANGGSEPILYCFVFLYLATSGGGSWSVDALRAASRRAIGGGLGTTLPR